MTQSNSTEVVKKITYVILAGSIISMLVFFIQFRMDKPSIASKSKTGHQTEDMKKLGSEIGKLMKRLEDNPNDIKVLEKLGRTFMMMKSWDRAIHFWNRALEVDPGNTPAIMQLAQCFYQKKNYQSAAKHLEKVISQDPSHTRAHFNLGILHKYYLDSGKKWEEHFRKVLQSGGVEKSVRKRAKKELEENKNKNY